MRYILALFLLAGTTAQADEPADQPLSDGMYLNGENPVWIAFQNDFVHFLDAAAGRPPQCVFVDKETGSAAMPDSARGKELAAAGAKCIPADFY